MSKALNPTNYAAPSAQNAADRLFVYSGADSEIRTMQDLPLIERSADPSDPPEGTAVIWQGDGTGTGDDGDILIKVTAGGATKTITLVDFSAAS